MKIKNFTHKAVFIGVFITLSFFGCSEPFSVHDRTVPLQEVLPANEDSPIIVPSDSSDTREMGYVKLGISDENARTILPTVTTADFKSFSITFEKSKSNNHFTYGETTAFRIKGGLEAINDTVYALLVGWYDNIVVDAFFTDDCDYKNLGARGEAPGDFRINASSTTIGKNIDLELFYGSGENGYFDWNIVDNTANNIRSGGTAKMTITPLGGGLSYEIDFINAAMKTGNGAAVPLGTANGFKHRQPFKAGVYNVKFEFGKPGYLSHKISEVLYIAPGNIVSQFNYTIPKLTNTSAIVRLNPNYSGSSPVDIENKYKLGDKIVQTDLTTPVYTGYEFKGWYEDSAAKLLWDFNVDRVYSNLTILYAGWEKKEEGFNNTKPDGTIDKNYGTLDLSKGDVVGKFDVPLNSGSIPWFLITATNSEASPPFKKVKWTWYYHSNATDYNPVELSAPQTKLLTTDNADGYNYYSDKNTKLLMYFGSSQPPSELGTNFIRPWGLESGNLAIKKFLDRGGVPGRYKYDSDGKIIGVEGAYETLIGEFIMQDDSLVTVTMYLFYDK
jgi:uncharacterized repeat protein (TIGR02543 family)